MTEKLRKMSELRQDIALLLDDFISDYVDYRLENEASHEVDRIADRIIALIKEIEENYP